MIHHIIYLKYNKKDRKINDSSCKIPIEQQQ